MERKFEEKIGEIRTEISKRTPNLRAKDKYDISVNEMKVRNTHVMRNFEHEIVAKPIV